MIKKIEHYSITNGVPTVYDEEAMTCLELAGRTAGKVNELIEDTDKRLNDQDKDIATFKNEVNVNIAQRFDNINDNVIPNTIQIEMVKQIEAGNVDAPIEKATKEVIAIEMLPYGRFIASDGYNYELKADELVKGEQYSNTNGQVVTGANAYRSKYIYPCNEGVFFTFDAIVNGDMQPYNYIACYDHNMQFIGFSRLSATVFTGSLPINVTLEGTCFIGLTFMVKDATTNMVGAQLHHIDNGGIDAIYHPYEHNNVHYGYYKNHWCDGLDTTLKSAENFDCVVFNVKGLKAITSTETNVKNAVFIDGNNDVISYGDTYEALTRGRLYEVPSNAVACIMNFSNQTTVQGTKQPNDVVGLVRKNGKGLNGKRVLAIGDSITWLDGQQGYDNTNAFKGWQDELRKRGAIVNTLAWSGLSLADDMKEMNDGIATKLNGCDIPLCDIGIIFGGSNDVRLGTNIVGVYEYENYSATQSSVEGAIDCMYQKIYYSPSQQCKMFVCSLIPSCSETHSYENDKPYNDAIKNVCAILPVTYIDLWNVMAKPYSGDINGYYDGTHPNYKGMAQIGRVIAREIERVIE